MTQMVSHMTYIWEILVPSVSNKLISINLLEFVVEIVSYAAVTVLFKDNLKLCSQPYPLLLNLTDNKNPEAWIKKTNQLKQLKTQPYNVSFVFL